MRSLRLPKKLLASVLAAALTCTPVMAFTDTEGHWAAAAIDKWSQQYGVLKGYDDGTFHPDASITRGAFAGILDRFLQFREVSPAGTFSDIKDSSWADAILKLNAAGVYLGNNGQAQPKDPITRQQAAAMVARAFHIDAETASLPYGDADKISSYAKPYIAEMTARGYFSNAKDGNFRPADPITRAELVSILNNMIQVLLQTPGDYANDVEGTLMINAAEGASLSNMSIKGDLILAPGVTGEVRLENVSVSGKIRNFSAVKPQIVETPPPGQSNKPSEIVPPPVENPTGPGITVTPITPADPVTPVEPEDPGTPTPPATPGIQPNEIYIPGATTGDVITYNGKQYPVYAGRAVNPMKQGDFVWNGTWLEYVGGEFHTRLGIDVSSFQNIASTNETIDWNAVRDDGIEFVMVRVGFRGYSNGLLTQDVFYRQNIQGAMDAGLETGAYIFAQAVTVEEAIEEADFIIERLREFNITGPVAYDWEINNANYRAYNVSKEMATACAVAFCQRVKEAGYTPMVYGGSMVSYVKYDQGALADYLYWYPGYPTVNSAKLYPTLYYQPDIWQFSSSCKVNGIGGNVDGNLRFYR